MRAVRREGGGEVQGGGEEQTQEQAQTTPQAEAAKIGGSGGIGEFERTEKASRTLHYRTSNDLLFALHRIASEASEHVFGFFKSDKLCVEYKNEDKSDPVTDADKSANDLIVKRLEQAFPGVPVVGEESLPSHYLGHETQQAVFFVDPIDGTKEFIAGSDEFSVMLGLCIEGVPMFGVVICPAKNKHFLASSGYGAFELRGEEKIPLRTSMHSTLKNSIATLSRLAGSTGSAGSTSSTDSASATSSTGSAGSPFSSSAGCKEGVNPRPTMSDRSEESLKKLGVSHILRAGGVGVKAMLVASGKVDLLLYPFFGGMRWDTCAPEIILTEAGGFLTDANGKPLDYQDVDLENKHGVVAAGNASLHAEIIDSLQSLRTDLKRPR